MENNYNVNYEDERFKTIETEKKEAVSKVTDTYNQMINSSDQYYQSQIDAVNQYKDTQTQQQQAQTNLAIEQINQQKDQAQKDYTKEQAASYVDWQKQSNAYGANAENMATQGLTNTGYSESSQVSMYNTYQNRVATARDTFNRAVLNYDNSIKEAQLANSSKLAEIAFNALQTQLQLSLEGFQYKNQLIMDLTQQQQEEDDRYYSRYQDVLSQINTENSLAESVRQYNENLALEKEQFQESIRQYEQNYAQQVKAYEENIRQFNQNYNLQVKEYEEGIRQFNEEIARLKAKDAQENALEIKRLEQQKQQLAQSQKQWEAEMAEKKRQFDAQLAEEQRQYNASLAKASSSRSYTSGSSGSTGTSYTNTAKQQTTQKQTTSNNPVTLTNGAKGYSSVRAAANASGINNPLSDTGLLQQGYVKKVVDNGKTYYYVPTKTSKGGSAAKATTNASLPYLTLKSLGLR